MLLAHASIRKALARHLANSGIIARRASFEVARKLVMELNHSLARRAIVPLLASKQWHETSKYRSTKRRIT